MITIGFSTRNDNQKYIEYLKKTCGLKNIQVIQKINNGEKNLSQTYNEILKESEYDYVVLCHDDIEFDTINWGKKIINHFNNTDFGILGVAGTTDIPESGMWWEDKRKMMGIVNHKHQGKKWESKYSKSWGDEITQGCFVDGLFIALNKKEIKVNFDESVDGFHFYDVYFSVNNFLKGVKVGVLYNIRLTHLSIGQTNEQWEKNRIIFSENYKESLPISSERNLNLKSQKNFKFLKKYNLKIILNSGKNLDWVESTLNKIESFDIPNYTINLICNEEIVEELKQLKNKNITFFDGFFDEMSKNLSVLKWEDNFVSEKDDLIFFIDKDVVIKNNIFSSITKLHHKEKSVFGCAFTSTLNDDDTIFCNEFGLLRNKNNQISVFMKDNGSYYNLLNGQKVSRLGNLSDVFATTYQNLIKYDWFDIQYDTNMSFNDFAIKCTFNNQKSFVDTDSISYQKSFVDGEKLNQDMNKLIQTIMSNQKYQPLIQLIND